jgi:hypothetical protein
LLPSKKSPKNKRSKPAWNKKLASLAKQEPKSIRRSEAACHVRSLLSRGSAAKAGSGGRVGRSFRNEFTRSGGLAEILFIAFACLRD